MLTITIEELGSHGTTRATTMRRKPDAELINRAVAKLWGTRCFWFADSGLGLYYGQVFEALGNRQNTSRTARARITIA